jgi:phospholipid/cholesterol/gamma-HCH transport system substrate-binding protein
MSRNVIETVMGAVVLLVAAVFLVFVYSTSNLRASSGYELIAHFNRVDGVGPGTDVRMSGIKIGTVADVSLDPKTYLAVMRLSIRDDVQLPTDSTAKVQSDGLLGGSYVAIEPGGADEMLAAGGEIRLTQDPNNIADLIGRFIVRAAEAKKSDSAAPESAAPQPAPAPAPAGQTAPAGEDPAAQP